MGTPVQIQVGERKTVGDYSISVREITNRQAQIAISYKFKAWEDTIMKYVQNQYGTITVMDMINWSRLHEDDLNGLRPMCEDTFPYECAMIFKVPHNNYERMSEGWFAPNHACSSIYVPIHICDTDIFDPYENGKAAELSLELLSIYGHNKLNFIINKTEDVFITELRRIDVQIQNITESHIDISEVYTKNDLGMQHQAWLTTKLWLFPRPACRPSHQSSYSFPRNKPQ